MNKDLEDEFFAFWHGDICILDVYPGDPGNLDVLFAGRGDHDSHIAFVTNDVVRTRLKLKAMSLTEGELLAGAAFRSGRPLSQSHSALAAANRGPAAAVARPSRPVGAAISSAGCQWRTHPVAQRLCR